MTRDMELIRTIIAAIQARTDAQFRELKIPGHDRNAVGRHVEMLIDEGYVDGKVHHGSMGTQLTPFVTDLTMSGHDFAASLKNESVWSQIKSSLSPSELTTVPLGIIRDLGTGLLKAYLMQKVGLGK